MREQLEQRLQSLKAELEAGEHVLADLEAKRVNIRETLLRISGAIQVLEEELAKAGQAGGSDSSAPGEEPGADLTCSQSSSEVNPHAGLAARAET